MRSPTHRRTPPAITHARYAPLAALAVLLVARTANAQSDYVDFTRRDQCYPALRSSTFGDWTTFHAFAQRGPLHTSLALGEGAFNRQPCARDEAGVAIQYGDGPQLHAHVFARVQVAPYHTIGFSMEAADHDQAATPRTTVGNLTLATTHQLQLSVARTLVALDTRLTLPTSPARGRLGGELGLAFSTLTPGLGWLEWHGYLGASVLARVEQLPMAIGPIDLAAVAIAGVQIHPYSDWYAFVIDVHARISTEAIVVAPTTGVRLQSGAFGLELFGGYGFATGTATGGVIAGLRLAFIGSTGRF